MDTKEFSEKLMKLSIEIQNSPQEKQKAFAKLFTYTKEALENGFDQEEIQIIVVTAFQVSTNPELKQLWGLLMGNFEIDPKDEFQ